ncbi:MAG TPA: T9SS type A sorting domain-containing protein [Rhodothermales bacterium]|nr:T9SS type A sorting domain-containing protein [Rhodothermales bacterium]
MWVIPFGGTATITLATGQDSIYRYSATAPVKSQTVVANQIFVYNPDGTPASFSPITYLDNPQGQRVDTVGFYRRGSRTSTSGRTFPMYDTRSGRGLRRGADGNIYAAMFNTIFRIDYKTGRLLSSRKNVYGIDVALTAPAVDAAGNVYTATVAQAAGQPIRMYSQDLQTVLDPSVVATPAGFSRSFEVNAAGTRLYWSGYTNHAVYMYKRNSDLDPWGAVPDTVLKGFDSESLTRHPVTGQLWVSSGSTNDMPNRYPNFRAPYTYQKAKWYAFDQASLTAATPNPTPRDSISWYPQFQSGDGRPRGIDFTQTDGNTAYGVAFNQPAPSVRKFVRALGAAVAVEGHGIAPSVRAFPNPARGLATVEFGVAQPGRVNVTVYDALGRTVATLVNEDLVTGTYRASFDGTGLPSGTYLYRVTAGGRSASGTLVLVQ